MSFFPNHNFFIFNIRKYTIFILILQIFFNKKEKKVIIKKLGKAKKKLYIGRNIKIKQNEIQRND
jgi:hypothetical protein